MPVGSGPIWFRVLAVIVVEMGLITPPARPDALALRNVAGDTRLGPVFRGATPFPVAMILRLVLNAAFRQIRA